MIVEIYPSAAPGEPLERHQSDGSTIVEFVGRMTGAPVDLSAVQPMWAEVGGTVLPVSDWGTRLIGGGEVVRLYPRPEGVDFVSVAIIAAVSMAASFAISYLMAPKVAGTSSAASGDSLALDGGSANTPNPNGVIPELLGTDRIYPDYLQPPRTVFADKRTPVQRLLLCVGVGEHSVSDIRIGDTPIGSFGGDVSVSLYAPGATLVGEEAAEFWQPVSEVGASSSGAGLDLSNATPSGDGLGADAVGVIGDTLTLIGDDAEIPGSWSAGTVLTLSIPDNVTVATVSGVSRLYGDFSELAPSVGQLVTLTGDEDGDFVVRAWSAAVPAVPGVGGSAASVTGNSSPSIYDFSTSPVAWVLSWRGADYALALNDNVLTMAGLQDAVSAQLVGSGLEAWAYGGRLRIGEPGGPYLGGAITMTDPPASVFGASVTYVAGTASTGGTPAQPEYLELKYASGTPVRSFAVGARRIAVAHRGLQYRVASVSSTSVTLDRLLSTGVVDATWPGFSERSVTDYDLSAGDSGAVGWIGPFAACPESETTRYVEYDVQFPSGLVKYSDSGNRRYNTVGIVVEWRDMAVGGAWHAVNHTYTERTNDALGYTHRLTLPTAIRPEIRMRRAATERTSQRAEKIQWIGLRSKLTAPTRFDQITVAAVTITGNNRLSAQSDRAVNMLATRLVNGQPLTIAGAVLHVTDSLGIDRSDVDVAGLQALQSAYWTPRGDGYNYRHTDSATALDVIRQILQAGMAVPTVEDGRISAIREGVSSHIGVCTPQSYTGELTATFAAPSPDDYDGVDVTYRDATSWTDETVECRLSGSEGLKVEKLTLDGVTDRDQAWQIGMRRLRKHTLQRWVYSLDTELDAMSYAPGDVLMLSDDVPGFGQSALILGYSASGGVATLRLSEPLDWTVTAPRCIIRRHDGTATTLQTPARGADDYHLTIPVSGLGFTPVTDLSIDPASLLFGPSASIGYLARIRSIEPDVDGKCAVQLTEYRADYYSDDNNEAPL